jgi:hypothetical protein
MGAGTDAFSREVDTDSREEDALDAGAVERSNGNGNGSSGASWDRVAIRAVFTWAASGYDTNRQILVTIPAITERPRRRAEMKRTTRKGYVFERLVL